MYAPDGSVNFAPDPNNPALAPFAAGVFDMWGKVRYVWNDIFPQFAGDMAYYQSLQPGSFV